ncbi:MAG: sulfatase [Gemmatimonadota bacterium]
MSGARKLIPEPILLAAWTGLAAGLVETLLLGVQKFAFHRLVFLSADALWMPAVADFGFFLIPGLVLWLVARARGMTSRALWFGVCAYLFVQSVLFMYKPLHKGAAMLIALGLAVQCARRLPARGDRIVRIARRTLPLLFGLVLVLAVGLHVGQGISERRKLAALPPAPHTPNILLLILDTTRALELGLYGYERNTSPGIDRLARSGVTFDRAFATAPWTLPSHASIFTGHLPTDFNADWNIPLDGRRATVAEALASHGYATAGFVANTIYATREMGLDRGFIHYEDHPLSLAQTIKSSTLGRALAGRFFRTLFDDYKPLAHKDAAEVNHEFTRWLDSNQGRPFFAFLNYFDTHSPYVPRAPFDGRFGPTSPRTNIPLDPQTDWSAEQIALQRNAYDACMAYMDSEIDSLFTELGRRGILSNTVVILTADHGEEMHEHGVMDHGNSIYRPAVQVPLIIMYPGHVPEGVRVSTPVTLRDLTQTMSEYAGLDATLFPGRSLERLWTRDSTAGGADTLVTMLSPTPGLPLSYPAAKERLASIVLGKWRYIRGPGKQEQVFDVDTDRFEAHDLVATPEGVQALPGLRAALDRVTNGWMTK